MTLESQEKKHQEGGARAWLTIMGSSLIYFSAFGLVNSFGFFQEYYQHTALVSASASTVSFIGTLQILLVNLLAAPAGSLFDCYGLKYLYIFSGIGCSGSLIILSFCEIGHLWQTFLVQGVLLGLAIAFGSQPALVVAGQHFLRRRALVMGIVAASGSVGGVCFPVILSQLVLQIGFGWSLRVVAIIIALCYTIALGISFNKYEKKPDGDISTFLDFKGFLDRRYCMLTVGTFAAMLGQFIPYYYISSYYAIVDPNSPAKDYLLPLMSATSIGGRVLGGIVADEIGPSNVTYPMTILAGVECLAMWLVTSNIRVLLAFVSLYGFCSGVFISVLPVIVAQISPEDRLGGRIGALYSVVAIAQLVGPPIGGALVWNDSVRGYDGLITFSGATMLLGGLVILLARFLHDRNIKAKL